MQRARWKAAAGTYPQIRKRALPLIVGTIDTHDVVDLAHALAIAIGDAARVRAIVAKAIEAVRGRAQDCPLARRRGVIGAAILRRHSPVELGKSGVAANRDFSTGTGSCAGKAGVGSGRRTDHWRR